MSKKIVPILSLYEPTISDSDQVLASGRSARYQGKLQLHSSTASIYKTPSLAHMTTTASIRSSVTDLVKFNRLSPHLKPEEEGKEERVSKFFLSIKFFLILIICGIVIMSSVVLSSTWIGALLPSIWGLSNSVKDKQVFEIVNNIKETIQEVLIVSSATKSQLVHSLNYTDRAWIEKHMYTIYKSELDFHKDLMITTYIGDNLGTCYGIITWDSKVALVHTNLNDQQLYFCEDVVTYDYCKRNSKPDITLGKFEMSEIVETANLYAGFPAFTLSYADRTMPQYVFISLINSWKRAAPVNGTNFDYYFGYDISVATLTTHVEKILDRSYGARFAIVETATNYIIAMDHTTQFLSWDSDRYTRMSINSVQDTQMKYIFSQISGDYSSMKTVKCNNQEYLSKGGYFIALHRYCTGNNIDWMIVYTVPEWNFTGSFIVGMLSALTGTVLIMIVSAIVGIIVSYRIVRPFNNLIELFESVSHMDLDRLTVSKTYFSEVVKLQKNFLFMVNRIRSYKSFIPPHLISQIENGGMEIPEAEDPSTSRQQSEGYNSNNSLSSTGSLRKTTLAKSGKKKYIASKTMFSLHLEIRQVTIVTILMEGLNEMLNEANAKEVVNLLSDVFLEISTAVKPKGGQLIGTDNDMFTISFNASTDLSRHEEKALSASQLLRDKLSKLKSIKWKNLEYWKKHSSFLDKVVFRTAILCQQSQTGNIGTSDSKTFTIIGSFKYNADALLEVAQRLDLDVVVTERLCSQFSHLYYMRFVDSVDLANDSMYTSPKFKEDNIYVGNVFEVGDLCETKADEWMYELEEQGKKEKWKIYNKACDLFFEMVHTEAIELFEEFLHQHNQTASTIDKPAHHLINVCRSQMEEEKRE